jgi:hypothetical protein
VSLAAAPPLIQLAHVSKIYRMGDTEVAALDDVSLDIARCARRTITMPDGKILSDLGQASRPALAMFEATATAPSP